MLVPRYTVLLATLCLLPALAKSQPPTEAEIIKKNRPGTALVDIKPVHGSAFCVHEDGYFVTAAQVVANLSGQESVTLLLNAGESTQKGVKASVVRKNATLNLALLKAAEPGPYATVPLGALADLQELKEKDRLIVFGHPVERERKLESYPGVATRITTIDHLYRSTGELTRIKLHFLLMIMASGGPVLDLNGKAIGLYYNGIGQNLDFVVPVSRIQQFLEQPDIAFTVPAIAPKDRADVRDFQARVVSLLPSKEPCDVVLLIKSNNQERRFAMQRQGDSYAARAALYEPNQTLRLQVEVAFADATLLVPVPDRTLKLPMRDVSLSQVKKVRFGANPQVLLADGTTVEGRAVELDQLTTQLGGHALTFATAAAKELTVQPLVGDPNSYLVSVIVSRAGKEVSRAEVLQNLAGTEPPGTSGLLTDKFLKPSMASQPTTYALIVGRPSDTASRSSTERYDATQVRAQSEAGGLSIVLSGTAGAKLLIAPPRGQLLGVGEYLQASRLPAAKDRARLSYTGPGQGSTKATGKFVIWELEIQNGTITRAAIDFIQHPEGNVNAPLVGVVRYNSNFK